LAAKNYSIFVTWHYSPTVFASGIQGGISSHVAFSIALRFIQQLLPPSLTFTEVSSLIRAMQTTRTLPEMTSSLKVSRRLGDLRGVRWRIDLGILLINWETLFFSTVDKLAFDVYGKLNDSENAKQKLHELCGKNKLTKPNYRYEIFSLIWISFSLIGLCRITKIYIFIFILIYFNLIWMSFDLMGFCRMPKFWNLLVYKWWL
jgi:hypothetical protein